MKRLTRFAYVALAAVVALGGGRALADKPIDRASATTGPDGSELTPDDYKELDELQDSLGRYEAAQKEYRGTVAHIVKQEYTKKRAEISARYDATIKQVEADERAKREDAIKVFEAFLQKYPTDMKYTPDVIFRLAELYFEKTSDDAMAASDQNQDNGGTPDFGKTIGLYKRLITEFPNYRLIDGAYYLLGYCLDKMGSSLEARQAFLALVCSNKFKALDPPAPPRPSKGKAGPLVLEDPYQTCKPVKDSRFLAEVWTRIGEYHFDYNELELAIAAFNRAMQFKDSPYYDKALYKLAWSYYRNDKYPEAIKYFDQLVVFSDQQKATTGKEGSDLRSEAVQYLGISFSEKDWDGDTVDDKDQGLPRIESFYNGRDKEPHVREIYSKLGDIYFDETEFQRAIDVYREILRKWPLDPNAPKVQDRIVTCYERMRNMDQALVEREHQAKDYGPGTEWRKHNADNKDATEVADDLAEQAIAKYAVEHHKAAKALKDQALATKDPNKFQQAMKEYALAADGYEKYLAQFENRSKNAYDYRFFYAEALFWSQHYAEAAVQYEKVRDSQIDNKYLEDSAFNAIKSYEFVVDAMKKSGQLVEPPLPAKDKVQPPIKPIEKPEIETKLEAAYDAYTRLLPTSAKVPTMAYKVAETEFRYLNWDEARKRFQDILKKYPTDAVAIQAGKGIITSYTIEDNLDQIASWNEKLTADYCGAQPKFQTPVAAPWCKELKVMIGDVRFKQADQMFANKEYAKAADAYLRIVDGDPTNQSGNNDKALNNAAVCFENLKYAGKATRIYERIVNEYPNSSFVDDALFRTAVNYDHAFEYDKAVVSYLRLATDPRFKDSQHRTDALFNASIILEYDQDYPRAAKMFQTYSKAPGVKPEDAADAYFRSATIYLKAHDNKNAVATFRQYIKDHPGDTKHVLEAEFRIAQAFEADKRKAEALSQYKKIVAEGASVQPASDPAEFVAQASFTLAEQQLPHLEAMKLSSDPKKLAKSIDEFKKTIDAQTAEYNKVLQYRRATWSLAAYYRIGYCQELLSKALAALLQAPCPQEVKRKGGQELCDAYQEQMTQVIEAATDKVDQEVVARYRATLDQAAKLGVSNDWTKRARQEANEYKPDEFPMTKDEHVDFQMENP